MSRRIKSGYLVVSMNCSEYETRIKLEQVVTFELKGEKNIRLLSVVVHIMNNLKNGKFNHKFDLEKWPWPWIFFMQNVQFNEIHVHAKYEVFITTGSKVIANIKFDVNQQSNKQLDLKQYTPWSNWYKPHKRDA